MAEVVCSDKLGGRRIGQRLCFCLLGADVCDINKYQGVRKRARVFVGESIVRETDRVLNKGDDVVVRLAGA